MADPKGFLTTPRETPKRRPVDVRIKDWREVYEPQSFDHLQKQAGRCMDCGIPYCHQGCPLGNLIPEWNDLIWRGDKDTAIERLHATNNFPEFTGRICPAPCEDACVVTINADAITIKQVELRTIEEAFAAGKVLPQPPDRLSGKTVAVIGSGPAGLAAAQQLTRAGHTVAVYERSDKIGGFLRYGIPEFKMEKHIVDRRLEQMEKEGTRFRTGVNVGVDITGAQLRSRYDAVLLAIGANESREFNAKGREAKGIYHAMDYLPWGNKQATGETNPEINVAGKNVIIIGGGDTAADCLGTAIRQGAKSVTQIIRAVDPKVAGKKGEPWPIHSPQEAFSSSHEELDNRLYSTVVEEFISDEHDQLRAVNLLSIERVNGKPVPVEGSLREVPADIVLLALGFSGVEKLPLLEQLEVTIDDRSNVIRDSNFQSAVEDVFVAGDVGRGQSLIVWAIAEGRSAAAAIDKYLTGDPSQLPAPLAPTDTAFAL